MRLKQMQIEQTYKRPQSILNFFSKFNIYYSNFKKKEKEFQCQQQAMFQSTKWFGFGVQDNLNKRGKKKKERKALQEFKKSHRKENL